MRPLRMFALAVALGALYALVAHATYRYLTAPNSAASFFPPAGITLATLLLTPRRTWPLWLAAFAAAELILDLTHGSTLFVAAGFALANTVEPFVGASLIGATRHRRPGPRDFLLLFVLFGAIAGPFFGALIGAAVTTISGSGPALTTFWQWWLGDGLGVLVVATPILAWARRDAYQYPAKIPELVLISGIAVLVTIAPPLYLHDSFAYAVLPIVLWAALRGGPLGAGHHRPRRRPRRELVGRDRPRLVDVLEPGHRSRAHRHAAVHRGDDPGRAHARGRSRPSAHAPSACSCRAETQQIGAELAAVQAAANERRRIVRETHDIVGHALNVMILSGAAARRVMSNDPQQAQELLSTVEDVGRDAFRDLDVALGLTDRSPELTRLKGLADVDELVDRLVNAGMHVDYEVDGSPRPLPKLVDGSAFRIIQESLTNVAKHAVNAHTQIRVRFEPETLRLEVSDHGDGRRDERSRSIRHRPTRRRRDARTRLGARRSHRSRSPRPGRLPRRGRAAARSALTLSRPIRVQIVDDDVATRVGLRAIMTAEDDIEVVGESSSAEEACRNVERFAPDVVLMDVQLPGADGIEATERIVSLATEPVPRVIVLTTFEFDDYVFRSLQRRRERLHAQARSGRGPHGGGAVGRRRQRVAGAGSHAPADRTVRGHVGRTARVGARAHGSRARGAGAHRGRPLEPGDRDRAHDLARHREVTREARVHQVGRARPFAGRDRGLRKRSGRSRGVRPGGLRKERTSRSCRRAGPRRGFRGAACPSTRAPGADSRGRASGATSPETLRREKRPTQ